MELRKLKAAIDKASAAIYNDRRPVVLDTDTARLLIEAASYYHDQRQGESMRHAQEIKALMRR